jgi:hypothetical protein
LIKGEIEGKVGVEVEVDVRASLFMRRLSSSSLGLRRVGVVIQAALLMKVNVSGVYQNKRRVVRSRVRWYGQLRRRIRLHGERENRYISGPGENIKKKPTKSVGKCSSLSVPSNLLEDQRHEYKL